MALPYKTGSQDGIDFINYLEIGLAGVTSGGVEKAIETKPFSSSFIPFAVFVHPIL